MTLLTDTPVGTLYTGDLDQAKALARLDRFVREGQGADTPTSYVVALCDADEPADTPLLSEPSLAEFGVSSTGDPEEAWRYALGAMFGPADEEYDEAALRTALHRGAWR